jgi:hypothetical protein
MNDTQTHDMPRGLADAKTWCTVPERVVEDPPTTR